MRAWIHEVGADDELLTPASLRSRNDLATTGSECLMWLRTRDIKPGVYETTSVGRHVAGQVGIAFGVVVGLAGLVALLVNLSRTSGSSCWWCSSVARLPIGITTTTGGTAGRMAIAARVRGTEVAWAGLVRVAIARRRSTRADS
jgi:hypothetical protein